MMNNIWSKLRKGVLQEANQLLTLQLLAHLSLIPMIIYGAWLHWIIALSVYFLTGCFGMTMTYHRLLTHKAWEAPNWFYYVGTLLGAYGLTGSPIGWVAVHREHHAKADKEDDPHSPHFLGFFKVQWLSMFEKVDPKYIKDMLRNKFQRYVTKYYYMGHIVIITILAIIDPMLAISAHLVPAAILWNAGSLVNTIGHMYGYRNYETNEESRNNPFIGYLVWGEGWHNNHHAYPKNEQFGHKWWELDIGGFFIRLLEKKENI